ncbi:MAG: hypothetical protein ISR34_11095, partial [Pirellulales bacterium]|nr:hypothetical protein [Pirellulales bacterium]
MRSRPGSLSETSLNEIGLTFKGELGNKGSLYYSPRWSSYSSDAFGDRFSHEFGGNIGDDGTINVGGWDIGFSPSYSQQHRILTETAQLTETENLGLGVNARYQINSATSFGLGSNYNLQDAERFNTQESLSYHAYISRELGADLSTSLTFTKGSQNTNTNFDADYDQLSASVNYQPSQFLYFSASLGQQER